MKTKFSSAMIEIALFIIELFVMFVAIFLGSRLGGLGIGFYGGLGVAVYGFGFQRKPGDIPFDVIQIIMGVICAIAAMQVAGGMDYAVSLASKALNRNPSSITFLAPAITFFMALVAGTGHTAYAILPVVAEVAKKAGVRPSRPLAASVVASQIATCGSPISAAVVWLASELEPRGASYVGLLLTLLPSCIFGCMLAAIVSNWSGKNLYEDEIFLKRVANRQCQINWAMPKEVQDKINKLIYDIEAKPNISKQHCRTEYTAGDIASAAELSSTRISELEQEEEEYNYNWKAKASLAIFLSFITVIVIYCVLISDTFKLFKPKVGRGDAIVCMMLGAAAVITALCDCDVTKIATCSTFRAGMNGCICVLGVAWMGDTFVKSHLKNIETVAGDLLRSQPWVLAIILFVAGALLYSQASTAKAIIPIAISMGLSNVSIVGSFPATAALFVLPTYPTLLAAVEMDDTGSTRIGSYIFNHPFILPGTLAILGSCAVAFGLGTVFL